MFGEFNELNFRKLKEALQNQIENKILIEWKNNIGKLCQSIGPSKKCFCNHLLKEHDHLSGKNSSFKCKFIGCNCPLFEYIPVHGSAG